MNTESTFQTVTDELLIELVEGAKTRLVFIAPGVRIKVAEALAAAAQRLPGSVNVILDVDAEVCRLGYGDIEGLKCLQEIPGMNGNVLNAQPGVRIGVVIADDDTLFYSPTPLLIEAEPTVEKNDGAVFGAAGDEKAKRVSKPNGVIIRKSVPAALAGACSADGNYSKREIGLEPVDKKDVEKAQTSLQKTPPKKFDLARQERVFSSKLCFMELEITDYQIASKKLELDPELFVVDDDTRKRLTNRFRVFDKDRMPKDIPYKTSDGKDVKLSMEFIDQRIKEVRKAYLINVGRWGTVILRSRMEEFNGKVDEIVNMLNFYKESACERVKSIALESCRKLAEEISEKLLKDPPAKLQNRLAMKNTREGKIEVIAEYIADGCRDQIDTALKGFDPKTKRVEKNITYETFSDKEFVAYLEKPAALGKGCMKEIFEEHDSARETEEDNEENARDEEMFA